MCPVITYGSSFGYVAATWASRPPHYLQHTYQEYVYRDPTVHKVAKCPDVLLLADAASPNKACLQVNEGSRRWLVLTDWAVFAQYNTHRAVSLLHVAGTTVC